MIIDQLPLLGGDVQGTDEFPIERGTTTYKTTQAALIKTATDAAAAAQLAADEANAKGLPQGGTAGQILAKIDSADYNTDWINPPDPSGFVSYAEAQTLTAAQQAQARNNIDTISAGSIATIESSPATQAHAIGEYIVYNGQLYKVTAAISAGESLTVGTNVEAANICNAVGAYTSEALATYAYATISIVYNMTTKICFLSVRGTSTVFPQQEVIINLPNYIVPKIGVLTVGHSGCAYVDVRVNGSVAIVGANKAYAFCTAIFPIN